MRILLVEDDLDLGALVVEFLESFGHNVVHATNGPQALARIDLRTHRGKHPRIGAVDVVPFVPLTGETMTTCVELAGRPAAAGASRLNVPILRDEEAAIRAKNGCVDRNDSRAGAKRRRLLACDQDGGCHTDERYAPNRRHRYRREVIVAQAHAAKGPVFSTRSDGGTVRRRSWVSPPP